MTRCNLLNHLFQQIRNSQLSNLSIRSMPYLNIIDSLINLHLQLSFLRTLIQTLKLLQRMLQDLIIIVSPHQVRVDRILLHYFLQRLVLFKQLQLSLQLCVLFLQSLDRCF